LIANWVKNKHCELESFFVFDFLKFFIPRNSVFLCASLLKIFLKLTPMANWRAKSAKKNMVLHFASLAALRENKICLTQLIEVLR